MKQCILTFTRRDGSQGGPMGLDSACDAIAQLKFLRDQGLPADVHDPLTKHVYSDKELADLEQAERSINGF